MIIYDTNWNISLVFNKRLWSPTCKKKKYKKNKNKKKTQRK